MDTKLKKSWSTKAVMQQIYKQHFWGGKAFDFYSGEGSHNPEIIEPYINAVIAFLKSHDNQLTVCDLGCGDFNVGKHFVEYSKIYIAIDIVDDLIKRNTLKFEAENLEFRCLDIAKDKLPKADCIIIRQVLQHLSNAEILEILPKLQDYKYLIVTEHLPSGDFIANKNKITNLGIRLKQNSGIDVLKAPFHLKVKSYKLITNIQLKPLRKGRISTFLYILE